MNRHFLCTVALVAMLTCFFSASALELPLLWVADTGTYTESGASVADVDNDGLEEAIVAGREEIIVLDEAGKEQWRWHAPGRFMMSPCILTQKEGPALIYGADISGHLSCVDGLGALVWQYKMQAASSWSCTVAADLDGDQQYEVVQTDEAGNVWALDALSGKERWHSQVEGSPCHPSVGDLDGGGLPQIGLITTKGWLYLLNHEGAVLWQRSLGGDAQTWATCAPVFFKNSAGESRIMAGSNEGQVFCFDAEGNCLWSHRAEGSVASSLSVGDFDRDGRADLFAITQLGLIYRYDEDGAILWNIDMQGRTLGAGAIADLDGDGNQEYLLSTQDGHMMALDQAGDFIYDYQFKHRTINITPVFGEITKASPGSEMIITGGEAGLVYCFGTPGDAPVRGDWIAYRGGEMKQGVWFGLAQAEGLRMTAENLSGGGLLSGVPVRFSIDNPAAAPLQCEAWCVRPDGSRQSAKSRVCGRKGVFHLPISASLPGPYAITWRLKDDEGKELFRGERRIELTPFANDRALVCRTVLALRTAAEELRETLPASASALQEEAGRLDRNLSQAVELQAAAPGAAEAMEAAELASAELVAHAQRAGSIVKAVRNAAAFGPNTSILPFEGTQWENRGVAQQVPSHAQDLCRIERRVVKDEHVSVSLGLFNVTGDSVNARVTLEMPETAPQVSLHRSLDGVTSLGVQVWDALPELDDSNTITISSLSTSELWLGIDTAGLPPGEHVIGVKVEALNGAGVALPRSPQAVPAPVCRAEIALHVLPFDMAPSGSIRLCMWANYAGDAVEDLLVHGCNVFLAPVGVAQYDGAKFTGVDFTALDERIDATKGNDVVLLLNGVPAIQGDPDSPAYAADLKAYLDMLVAHMAENGIDTAHFALYPYDEPGGHGWHAVNQLVKFGNRIRAANPDVMIYVDGGGELPMFEAMAPVIDIWVPSIIMLAEDSAVMDLVRGTGKALWSYDCVAHYARPVGANTKDINLAGQYLTQPLFALRHDATGIGYWCYNISGEDPWGRMQLEYPLVYPGREKTVTSRRWEAVREGIEEYRIVAGLKARMDDVKLEPSLRKRIHQLIEVRLPQLVDPSFQETYVGLARYVLDAGMNEHRVNAFRAEALECAEAVAVADAK